MSKSKKFDRKNREYEEEVVKFRGKSENKKEKKILRALRTRRFEDLEMIEDDVS